MLRPLIRPIVRPLLRGVTEPAFGGWSPLQIDSLVAWYDASDMGTLFQDAAGTTAGAVGQSIGLRLDKSRGLAMGANLYDGPSAEGAVALNANGTVEVNGDEITCTCTSAGTFGVHLPNLKPASGTTYKAAADLLASTLSGNLLFDLGGKSGNFGQIAGNGRSTVIAGTTSTAAGIIYRVSASVGQSFTVRVLSVRELPGYHAAQNTGGARPVLTEDAGEKLYFDFDGVDDALPVTFPDLGADCVIARSIPAIGAEILTGQSVSGAWSDATDSHAVLIFSGPLSDDDTWRLTEYLNRQASLVAQNISGDFSDGANWATTSADVTLSTMTVANFLLEQPSAVIPHGHVSANGVLKISIEAPGTHAVVCKAPRSQAFSKYKNITTRMYMPTDQADRWASIAGGDQVKHLLMASAYPSKSDFFSRPLGYDLTTGAASIQPGNFRTVLVPASWRSATGLRRTLSYIAAAAGSPEAGDLEWIEIQVKGDATASAETPLVVYLLDIAEVYEQTPTVYFRFDDSADEHRAVSLHMRAASKFGGGSLATSLPVNFCVIPENIDSPERLTTQNLRDMVAEGSSLAVHGTGSTWSTKSDAQIVATMNLMRSLVTTESWDAKFGDTITFPGNDFSRKTTDGTRLKDLAASNGFKLNTGHASFGYGFIMRAMEDPLNGAAVIAINPSSHLEVGNAVDATTLIEHMTASGLSIVLMGHQVGAGGIAEADFDAVMGKLADEIANGRIRTADIVTDAGAAGLFA